MPGAMMIEALASIALALLTFIMVLCVLAWCLVMPLLAISYLVDLVGWVWRKAGLSDD